MSPSCVLMLVMLVAVAQGAWPPPLPSRCTMDQVKSCLNKTEERLPPCFSMPEFDDHCCPNCWLYPQCTTDPALIPICAQGQEPKVSPDTGCLTCRFEEHECTDAEELACKAKIQAGTLPVCPIGVAPRPDGACCITCRVAVNPYCNATSFARCEGRMHYEQEGEHGDFLPICNQTQGEQPQFDPTTCCRTCMPRPPRKPEGFHPGAKCDPDDIRECLEEMPFCADNEIPVKDGTVQCCQSCRRRERNCTLDAIMTCRANMRDCAPGERPTYAEGQYCCPTCRPTAPVCSGGCATGFICVNIPTGPGTVQPKCKRVSAAVRLRLRALDHVRNLHLLNSTLEEVEALLEEIVARFCDQNVNADRCNKYQSVIEHMEMVMDKLQDHLELEIKVPNPDLDQQSVEGGRRTNLAAFFRDAARAHSDVKLNALDGGSATVQLAVNDAESGSGYTMQPSGAHPAFTLSLMLLVALVGLVTML